MNISIDIPDDIADRLGSRWNEDLSRRALEALVAQAFREKLIPGPQAQELLGFSSRIEFDGFLKQSGIDLDYGDEDLDADLETLDGLLAR